MCRVAGLALISWLGSGCSASTTTSEAPAPNTPARPAALAAIDPVAVQPRVVGESKAAPPAESTKAEPASPHASSNATPGPPPDFRYPVVEPARSVVRVLMYHSVGWFSEQRPAVTPYSLRTQLEWMRDHEIEVIRVSQLLEFLEGDLRIPARAAVITIDDGERNAYTVAYPILAELEAPFALAAPTDAVVRHASRGTVTWQQIREMVDSGLCELLSHGHTHRDLTALDERALERELSEPRALLEHHVGIAPDALAYPLGAHSEELGRKAQAAGYRAAFVARGGPVTLRTPRFAIPRYGVEKETSLFAFAYFFRHPG